MSIERFDFFNEWQISSKKSDNCYLNCRILNRKKNCKNVQIFQQNEIKFQFVNYFLEFRNEKLKLCKNSKSFTKIEYPDKRKYKLIRIGKIL